jgi:RHS repeat-associated protein
MHQGSVSGKFVSKSTRDKTDLRMLAGMHVRAPMPCMAQARRWTAACLTGFIGLGLSLSASALPSVKIGTAPLIFPSAAEAAYPTSNDATHTFTFGTSAPASNEIAELSRALDYNVDNIYNYVRNYVDTEFMFGAQKGALGAMIDKSGTPFDQAELMVALLRQKNSYVASYQLGQITLNAAQFQAWTNLTNAQAACNLLASGGIPASVNGSSATIACSSISSTATVTTVTMEHIWVDVIINGTHYEFDPSYKPYNFTNPVPLATAAGLTTGQALAAATSTTGQAAGLPAYTSGTIASGSINYVQSLNAESLNAQLTTYASNLQNYIQNQNSVGGANVPVVPLATGKIIDLVGGREIQQAPPVILRQTSLPYPSATTRTWTVNVPDQFRASFTVTLTKVPSYGADVTTINNLPIFPDEVYGWKLIYNPNFGVNGENFTGSLEVVDEFGVVQATLSSYTSPDPPIYSMGTITLAVNHPYLADANGTLSLLGTYMDTVIVRPVHYATPFTIVHGWGEANRGLIDTWASRPDMLLPPKIPPGGCDNTCTAGHRQSANNAQREQLSALWLVQTSKAARLHASIANSIYTHHHTVGVVAGDTEVDVFTNITQPNQPATLQYFPTENFDRIDADTSMSVTSTTSNASDRRVAIEAIAATMDALEGSVSAQQADLPDTTSTATRFEWANRPPGATDDPSGPSGTGIGPRVFYDFNSSNVNATNLPTLTLVEGNLTSPAGNNGVDFSNVIVIDEYEVSDRQSAFATVLLPYTSAGFRVIASQEAFLGPGQRAGALESLPHAFGEAPTEFIHHYSKQRGGAFVAFLLDANGDPLEIAHVAANISYNNLINGEPTAYGIKGGGGGNQPDQQSNYDPSMAADILKGQFVDRSEVLGVDMETGGLTYTTPATLTVGNGKFPYSLSANLTWRGGIRQDQSFSLQSHVAPNTPWTTNWNNALTVSGSALEAMGQTDVRAAAGTVATFLAMQDVYRSPISAQQEVAAVLVGSWWTHQLTGNVVSASVGTTTRQFVQKFDGTWFAPGAKGYATLTQTGQRVVFAQPSCTGASPTYVITRGWNYANVGFVVTNENGDQQNFQFWQNYYEGPSSTCAILHGFRLTNWTFPYGMAINFTYQPDPNGFGLDALYSVQNTLGREIHFTDSGYGGFDNALTGANLQSVSIVDPLLGSSMTSSTQSIVETDPAGAATTINFDTTPSVRYQLNTVFNPVITTSPELYYQYDTLDRVEYAYDAVANLPAASRGPYTFFIADGARADRVDPAGGNYTVVYDLYRRPSVYYNELGYQTTATYDGRGRVLSYQYPELNQQLFTYDDRNNTLTLTRKAKPGSTLTFLPIQATWDPTWNKLASITDSRGCTTTFSYYPAGSSGASLMQNATRCKPDPTQANPVYTFTYNSYGQPLVATDPTNLQHSNSYDTVANASNLLISTLDPTGINAPTHYAYDPIGNTTSITDPNNNVTEQQYDPDRRKTITLHHNGGITANVMAAERTIYDTLGRDTEDDGGIAFSGTTVTSWQTLKKQTYTATSKLLTSQDGAGDTTTYSYDYADRVNLVNDPANRNTASFYDAAGEVLCTWRGWSSTTAPNVPTPCQTWSPSSYTGSGQVRYALNTYSPNGDLWTVTDANNNQMSMVYDGVDRLSTLNYPLPTIGSLAASSTDYESYGYDADDNRTSVRKRDGQVINYTFDSLNRQTLKILPSTTTADVWTTYDLAGRPLSDYFGSATVPTTSGIAYGYDSAKRMTSETQFGRAMAFQYDLASNRTVVTWPDGNYINHDFDAMNREWQIRENGATSGVGVLAIYQLDPLSRKQTLTRSNGTVTNYGYDPASRLNSLTQNMTGSAQDQTIGLQYTAASQLWIRSSSNALYDWMPPVATTAYVADGLNRYSTVAGSAFAYDARDNLQSDGVNTYSYDVENRLLSASGPTAVTLGYDPLGRLQETTAGGTVTQYLYDGTRLAAELDGSGNVLRRYVHGPGTDTPIVWYEGATLATRNYLHADERGSVIATTNSAGVASIYPYGPYGEPASWGGSRFSYTGQTAIPEAHLYYYKARIYSPNLGRFLQTDPIGTKDDLNLYTYTGNDPLDRMDPTGLAGCKSGDKTFTTCTITVTYDKKTSKGTLTVTGENKGDKSPSTLLTSSVVVGGDGHVTPTGTFTASYWEKDHVSTKYGSWADTPYSKTKFGGNAFGPFQLHIKELDKEGIYIHGTMGPSWNPTTKINNLISPASHGCVRMCNADDIALHNMMPHPEGNKINISAKPEEED